MAKAIKKQLRSTDKMFWQMQNGKFNIQGKAKKSTNNAHACMSVPGPTDCIVRNVPGQLMHERRIHPVQVRNG